MTTRPERKPRATDNPCNHDMGPDGYIDRAEWKEQKAKTHEQTQCPRCGLWAVWIKRESDGNRRER